VTRDAVVDAVIEAIREHGVDFSVQDVADRAGMTHRTVYRYFASRDALFDAVAERYEGWLAEQGIVQPAKTFDDVLSQIETLFRLFDQKPDLVRAVAVRVLVAGKRTRRSEERTRQWLRMFEASFPHLPPEEVRAVFAICRTLTGAVGWHLLTSQFHVPGDEAARGVRRTVAAVYGDLQQREEAARRLLLEEEQ
jgi:AcrR family transcriptional regulator